MSRIFLSHSSADELEAVALVQWLAANGWDDVFLDVDAGRGLVAGQRWQDALRRAADRCEAIIFIVSPAWATSKWCLAEFLLAKSLNKLIFGVVLKDVPIAELPVEMTSEWQLCRLVGDGPAEMIRVTHRGHTGELAFLTDGLERLRAGLHAAGLNTTSFSWPPPGDQSRSPYRGLEPLDMQDAAVFFGRDAEILQGLDKLRGMRAAGDEGLLVILGASGAGKSSFLRAGLLPRLARDQRHFYALPVVRPERSPLFGDRGLAFALARAQAALQLSPANPGDVKVALASGPARFQELLRALRGAARARLVALPADAAPPTLVLPVDQAEELFTAEAGAETQVFLELVGGVLREAVDGDRGDRRLPLIVVFTIRSDRYEPLQTAPELASLKTVLYDALRPMPASQFKEVILGPASRALSSGRVVEFKPDLVRRLLDDCASGADTLPLLSLTLARLYSNYGADGDLRLDEYERMGGMADVIKTEAESVLSADPDVRRDQLELLHAAFIPWLATIGAEDDQPARRIARLSDLPPASRPLVQALIEKRLLLTDSRHGEPIVEVAHESLLRHWDTIIEWLRIERDDLKEADRLEQAAAAWTRSGRKVDWLFEGERVAIAEALAAKPSYRRRLEVVAEFLLASRQRESERQAREERARQAELNAAREKQAAAEALAAEQQRATARARADAERLRSRGRQLLGVAGAAVLAAVVAGWFGWQASRESSRAQQQFLRATALRINSEAQAVLSGVRPGGQVLGLLKLLAGYRIDPDFEIKAGMLSELTAFEQDEKILEPGVIAATIAFSPDGARIMSIGPDDMLRSWDVKTGQPVGGLVRVLHEPDEPVAFSPDGTRVVSSGSDGTSGTLRIWDAATGNPIGPPHRASDYSHRICVAFNTDGSRIVSVSGDETLRLWDGHTGEPLGQASAEDDDELYSVAFSRDGTRIVSGGNKTLRVWNAADGRPIGAPMVGHSSKVLSVAFNREGTRIVSGGSDHTVRLWDALTGEPNRSFSLAHEGNVNAVAFSPDGRYVVSASEDGTLQASTVDGLREVASMHGHAGPVTLVAFSPDGARILSASKDETLRLWNLGSARVVKNYRELDVEMAIAISPDGKQVVSGSTGGMLQRWNLAERKAVGDPMLGQGAILDVAFSPDSRRLVVGTSDKTVEIWNVATGQRVGTPLTGHISGVSSVTFSRDGSRIASASNDGTIRLWNPEKGQAVAGPMIGHEGGVTGIGFSADGLRIFSTGHDGTIRIWDAKSGRPIGSPVKDPEGAISALAVSPDGDRIAIGHGGGTIRLWDARSLMPAGGPMVGHVGFVRSVAFSPDRTTIASAGQDQTVRMWDAASGQPIATPLRGHQGSIRSVAFTADGAWIVSSGYDLTIRLWPAPSAWPDVLCSKVTRNMSRREWREWVSTDVEYRVQCPGLPVPPDEPAARATGAPQ